MEELEFILSQRKIIQDKYLKEAKNVWTEFDGVDADKKHKKLYNEYRNKDYFLEGLQAKLEDILKDIEYYKSK
jgi:hypothetical protein